MLSPKLVTLLWVLIVLALPSVSRAADGSPIQLLFLGDNGHHQPQKRFEQIAPVMAERGIKLTYTNNVEDMNEENLSQFAGVVLYANIEKVSDGQAKALLEYVASGKGFIPLHCASA